MPNRDEERRIGALLKRHYRLRVHSVTSIAQGSLNQNYGIETPAGVYCLKQYDARLYERDRVRRAVELQDVVRDAGIPVPAVVPSVEGQVVCEADRDICVLSQFVPGRHHTRPQIPVTAALAMGRTLGNLHAALFPLVEGEPYVVPDADGALNKLEEALVQAERFRARSAVDETACEVLRYKIEALHRPSHLAGRFTGLRTQLTRGDYQETNVTFDQEDRVAAVLDFDNWRRQPRGVEIMRALTLCFLQPEGLLPEAWHFFAGYVEVVPLPTDEVVLYAPRLYLSVTGAWPVFDRYEKPESYQPRWDRFISPPSDWWERHVDLVTESLLGILHENV